MSIRVDLLAAGDVVLAGELIQIVRDKLQAVGGILLVALGVFCIWFVFKQFMHTGSIAALVSAVITVALVLFVANNLGWLAEKFSGELKAPAAAAGVSDSRGSPAVVASLPTTTSRVAAAARAPHPAAEVVERRAER